MSYAGETGSLDTQARRDPVEAAAAQLLGSLLIGGSRLDLALQLYVAALPPLEPPAASRLERLLALADTLADKSLRAEFVRWIVHVRQLEPLGRALRTGRWLPDPRRNLVLLLAAPGEPKPGPASYTLAELEQAIVQQRELLTELQRLCMAERGLTAASAAAFLSTQPIGVAEEAGTP